MRKQVLTVLVGSAGGAIVALGLTPFVTRIFSLETFGAFATFSAVASIFVGASTLRLEVLAVREADVGQRHKLMGLALAVAIAWGIGLGIVTAFGVFAGGWPHFWLLLGPAVTVASLQLISGSGLSIQREYGRLSSANFVQGAGASILQVLIGLFSPTMGALLAGFFGSRLVWLLTLPTMSLRQLRRTWEGYRGTGLVAGGSAVINSLSSQLPILLTATIYGQASVALLAMGLRLLVAPLSLVGQAAGSVVLGEVGARLQVQSEFADFVRRGVRGLILVGVGPCIAAAVLAPMLAPIVLGVEWSETGPVIALLTLGALAQLGMSPFGQILNLTDNSGQLLRWDLFRMAIIIGAFAFPAFLGGPFLVAVGSYSLGMCVIYIRLWFYCRSAAENVA